MHMKVCIYVRVEKKNNNTPFDLDVTQIQECDFPITQVILTKTHPKHHFNMHNNVKQD